MKQLIRKFKQISILILAITLFGCTNDDATLPKVVAGFTYTFNQDTGTVTFINISENGNTYNWNFGDESTSTEINPVKTYPNGTYTVTLKAKNSSGASDTFSDDITILIPETATLPISFDGANTKYEPTVFGGVTFSIVSNPDPSGANTSTSKVGSITNIGAAYEGYFFDLGSPIDLSLNKTIQLLFWSDKVVDVLIKLEGGTAADIQVSASHSGTGWEVLYFTFDSAGSYPKFTMFVDGPGTTAGTFYIDDITQISTEDIPCTETNLELPIDFDCNGIDYATKIVGNVSFAVIDNPELSGINNDASEVGKITNVGANWENAFFNLDTPVDFSIDKGIKFKLFSNQALPIKLKFEDGTETPVEADVNHNGTGWEELTFTFTSSASYNDMIIFVDGPGTAAGTFYIDDIEQVASTTSGGGLVACNGGELINDFESSDNSIFTNFGGGVGTIETNTDTSVNTSAKLGKYVKNAGELYGGITIGLASNIDFNAGVFSINVFSQSVRQLLFKLEGLNIELTIPTSGTGWETIEYDFSGVAGNVGSITGITLIMDNGTAGDGSTNWTILFDNIRLCSGGTNSGGGLVACNGGELINDFESSDNTIFNNFGGGVGTIENNTDTSINTSVKVGQYVKNLGELYGGITIALASNIDFNAGVFSIDVFSQSVRQLLFKLEGLNIELTVPTSGTGWETIEYDFSGVAGNVGSVTGITLIIDNGTAGDGSANWTILFDNIRLCSNGGTSTCPAPPAGELLSNGDFEANNGDGSCWQFNAVGGIADVSNAEVNTGTYSAKLTTGTNQAPNIKMERFAPSIAGGVTVQVTFKYKITTALGVGSIFQVLAFSEKAGGAGAAMANLGNAADTPLNTWNTFTNTFVTDAATAEGISLLIQLTGSGNAGAAGVVYVDDVKVTQL